MKAHHYSSTQFRFVRLSRVWSAAAFATLSAFVTAHASTEVELAPGSSVTLSVEAEGTKPFSYQWLKNGVALAGATESDYTIASASTTDAGSYSVEVSNAAGATLSDLAVVTVTRDQAPEIVAQPLGRTAKVGATVTFTASASGSPSPSYQWEKNGVPLVNGGNVVGATGGTLTLVNVTHRDAGTYALRAMNGAGTVISAGAILAVEMQAPDFNGDGHTDLYWQNTVTGERYLWLLNAGAFGSSVFLGHLSLDWRIVGSGDFNNDGQTDLIWRNIASGDNYIWLMEGTSFASSVYLGRMDEDWRIAGSGDFNSDGRTDLIWENSVAGDRYLWLMEGTVFASSVYLGRISTEWWIAGSGDFNNDGQADLIWENVVNGDRYLWLMSGTEFASSVYLGMVGTEWRIAGSGDFDNDGQSDLLWQNSTTGHRYVWLMNEGVFDRSFYLGQVGTEWTLRY